MDNGETPYAGPENKARPEADESAPTNPVVEGMSSIDLPDTLVEDKEEAVEAAYAQKPFIDARLEHADDGKLSPEVLEALDWLGSDAAEKAMAKYRAGKEEMTEAEQAILEKAASFRSVLFASDMSSDGRKSVESHIQTYPKSPENQERALSVAEKVLARIVDTQTKAIMDRDDISERKKLSMITSLSAVQKYTRSELGMSQGGGSYPDDPKELVTRWGRSGKGAESLVPVLWGMFAGKLGRGGQETNTVMALEQIAKLSGKPFSEIYAQVDDLFSEAATELTYKQYLDSMMERNGYLWSDSHKKYVRMATEVS